ncbi:MAG: tol-pal system protein YbgF [Nitrospira sp.]|jgi:tol-pal system protein YbgF|nr:tol-pal system protein YbgF [Nitrospira sp.]MCW5788473.1 tol-pal system protein YbgF [Nitrospira sp.]MDR4473229.1 tol-pal system protein YbgF [Nitrospira sp.]MDR4477511.1 tol-pal system protein YbgF [Nitrospira sp.]HAP41373.1 tol-pal system protein YbgF [Nitrospira sp.]
MKLRLIRALQMGAGLACGLVVAGCAKHADFLEIRDQLSLIARTQDQEQKRFEAMQRRLESLERVREPEGGKLRLDEALARLQKLEGRLGKIEEAQIAQAASIRSDLALAEASRQARASKPSAPTDAPLIVPGVPSITPTSAFNLAYNDYLNGKFDLAVSGFQHFIRDFPSTSLTPNAHYWLGESYYGQKDYIRAMQSFEHVVNEYAGNEKVPAALFKLGLSAAETGDTAKSRKYLKRVIEEYSTSDEAKLAKTKMAEIR